MAWFIRVLRKGDPVDIALQSQVLPEFRIVYSDHGIRECPVCGAASCMVIRFTFSNFFHNSVTGISPFSMSRRIFQSYFTCCTGSTKRVKSRHFRSVGVNSVSAASRIRIFRAEGQGCKFR